MKKDKKEVEKWYDENQEIYNKLVGKLENLIQEIIDEQGIAYNSISGRVKEKDSFFEKTMKDKYKDPVKEITDVAGIRIIAYVNSDVERISKLIEEEFDIDYENSIDKGRLLGVNKVGYKSIHYIAMLKEDRYKLPEYRTYKDIKFEIQIRTLLQHAWSEIEHDRNYKFSGKLPEEIKRKFALLAGNLELIDIQFQEISDYIDKYAKEVAYKVSDGQINNLLIDSTSLREYINNKYSKLIENGVMNPDKGMSDFNNNIIDELRLFNVTTLKELDELLSLEVKVNNNFATSAIGIIRYYMIVKDTAKYFKNCWSVDKWQLMMRKDVEKFEEIGIDIIKEASKCGIDININSDDDYVFSK